MILRGAWYFLVALVMLLGMGRGQDYAPRDCLPSNNWRVSGADSSAISLLISEHLFMIYFATTSRWSLDVFFRITKGRSAIKNLALQFL